ncbi:MAG: sugar phosphate isomerase/epimerase [Ruminococcaceae bacterium]|nr:sugar phosphate isomerase/epimerase [Oscillospiraceae bacterium]
MKLSIQTGGACDTLGVDAGMKAIREAGFDAIDFGALCDHYPWEDAQEEKRCAFFDDEERLTALMQEYVDAAQKYGLSFGQFHAPFPSFYPRKPEATKIAQEMIYKSIELCGKVGCPYIIIHPCFDGSARFPSMTKEEEYQLNIEFYSAMIPLLKKYDIVCCLENMWIQDWKSKKIYFGCCSDMREACRYIDDLNAIAGEKRFGFCLDIGHLLLLGLDSCYAMEELGDRLVTIHAHDNDGVNDTHTLPYMGLGNWNRFIKGLREIDYQGTLNFETSGFNAKFPKELIPDALKMLGATAKYLRDRIESEEK